MRNAPIITAVAALPGMPSVSRWIMAPPVEPFTLLSEATSAARVAAAEELGRLRELLLEPVGHEGRHGRARPREAAHRDAHQRAARQRPAQRPRDPAAGAAAPSAPGPRAAVTRLAR